MMKRKSGALFVSILALALISEVRAQDQGKSEVQTAHFIDATGDDFVYYSLGENRVATPAEVDAEKWDIGFKKTQIRINGSVQLLNQNFEDVTEAPMLGYKLDEPDRPALDSQAGEGWFNYDTTTHIVEPKQNQTFVIATADDKYAKLEILDYYKQDEIMEEGEMGTPGFYSFRYVYLEDGSRRFSEERRPDDQ